MKDRHGTRNGVPIDPHRPSAPLFGLGSVYATPAVLQHLKQHGRRPSELIGYHAGGDWGHVPPAEAAANDRSIQDGSRILSAYLVEGRRIWVITDAANDNGARTSTVLLFAEEY
ncbi:hypothetical protein FN976_01710 [Caenimonas sedimenti]|uniref:Type I restriction endonuclease subunit M n=1 Tax=Caenimonas sedimenti TaxID=2596921 RepID=A0A562ZWK8_9BURK|nr:hypothetical protein FN976_01710 [Caenimonas sedimenti]